MQKLTDLKNYLHELSFLALTIKMLFFSAGYGEALVLIFLVISMAYKHWIAQKQVDQYSEVKSLLEKNNAEQLALINDHIQKTEYKFDNIAAKFNSQNIEKSFQTKTPFRLEPQGEQNEQKRRF